MHIIHKNITIYSYWYRTIIKSNANMMLIYFSMQNTDHKKYIQLLQCNA